MGCWPAPSFGLDNILGSSKCEALVECWPAPSFGLDDIIGAGEHSAFLDMLLLTGTKITMFYALRFSWSAA